VRWPKRRTQPFVVSSFMEVPAGLNVPLLAFRSECLGDGGVQTGGLRISPPRTIPPSIRSLQFNHLILLTLALTSVCDDARLHSTVTGALSWGTWIDAFGKPRL
jgi:hypothetical protein